MSDIFGAASTTDQVLQSVNLSGKRVLVTGVSAGLGVETARALAAHGAQVVGAARNLSKAKTATEPVRAQAANGGSLDLVQLDLASLDSVRSCADSLLAAGKPFDLIIANAGVMACPKSKTVDGFETQFGTNHLGHFVLVNRIASLLKSGSRLVNLSSAGHRYADVDLEDPNFEHTRYEEFVAYGRSKTANVLFAVEFDRRHKARGVRATAVHPGGIQTELGRYMTAEVREKLIANINASQPKGAGALQLEEHSARGGDFRVGRLRRKCRSGRRPLLRGLPCRRGCLNPWASRRRTALCPRSATRAGTVAEERRDGRRAI